MTAGKERKRIASALRGAQLISGNFGWKLRASLGMERDAPGCDVLTRIANLIDPDMTTDTTKTPADTTKCDRDALLALADEMMDASIGISSAEGIRPLEAAYLVQGYARRIREACGEVD